MTQQVCELFGIQLAALSRAQAVQRRLDAVARDEHLEVAVVNAAKIVYMRSDPALNAAVSGCPLILADGQSVVWASRISAAACRRGLPVSTCSMTCWPLLPGTVSPSTSSELVREVLSDAVAQACKRHPGLLVAGHHHGYFSDEEAGSIVDGIRESGAKMLFLGMTSPKKETFCAEHGMRTGAALVHGVGGSFDILAGGVRRAPGLWQRLGLDVAVPDDPGAGPDGTAILPDQHRLHLHDGARDAPLAGRRPARGDGGRPQKVRGPAARPAADRLIVLPDTDLAARLRGSVRSKDPGHDQSRGPDRAPTPLPSDA